MIPTPLYTAGRRTQKILAKLPRGEDPVGQASGVAQICTGCPAIRIKHHSYHLYRTVKDQYKQTNKKFSFAEVCAGKVVDWKDPFEFSAVLVRNVL